MDTVSALLDKSKEAFILAIEIYNKPSIRYRLEGFSFFICNAWELMLKAYIIKKDGESAIYYHDKPDRTISLENCIQTVFTNENAPLRKNLEKIVELRNISTHFITEEYEAVYTPLLQACVFNFVDKMQEYHAIDMTEVIPENFITLSVRLKSLNETEIRAKYSNQVADRLLSTSQQIEPLIESNNSSFAIRVEHYHYATKDKNEATELYHIDNSASAGVRVIKELKDPNKTHKLTAKTIIDKINKKLCKEGIVLRSNGEIVTFNKYHFNLVVSYFNLKCNERMCFVYHVSSQPRYSYSLQALDFIYEQLKKEPDTILDDLKKRIANPGSKGF